MPECYMYMYMYTNYVRVCMVCGEYVCVSVYMYDMCGSIYM